MKKLLIVTALLGCSTGAMAQVEFTNSVDVRSVETLTNSQTTFVRSAGGGWGHTGCPAAQFVNLAAVGSASYKEQLAIALTAKASGSKVTARGVCSPNGTVVVAERLRLD